MSAPKVSVIMPCLNEGGYIRQAVESLQDDWFRENGELIVIDGMSEDGTMQVVESLMKEGFRIRLLNNEQKTQAHGLNIGIDAAEGEIIVRADAHCLYPEGYVRRCVELLEETGAANAGGMMSPAGNNDGQTAVAWAFKHPIGVGDARWHLGNYRGEVDMVYLGTFRKALFDEIGPYDTRCRTNEDGELNLRIRRAGKKIYLDSTIKVVYFPRETLRKLAKQYYQYGKGRAYTTRKHKRLTSWRQVMPVGLVVGLAGALGLAVWKPVFLIFPAAYVGAIFLTAFLSWPREKISLKQRLLIAAAWGIMHVSWGIGFIRKVLCFRGSHRY